MHMETWADIFLVFFVMLFAIITVALFGVIAFTLRKVEQQIEKVTNMAEPLVAKASGTLDTVQRITVNAGEKVDSILIKGETLTDDLTVKVEQTSAVVQKTVTGPLISLSSLISGLSTGVSTWSRAAKNNAKVAGAAPRRNGVTARPGDRVAASVTATTDVNTLRERVAVIMPDSGTERVTITPNGR